MLQKLPKCSIKAVLKLYNHIWLNDDFPVSWRHSIVLPVLKPGKDPLNPVSYRPISLTPTLCKLLEKMVTNRLTYFVEKHSILNNLQCGFRKLLITSLDCRTPSTSIIIIKEFLLTSNLLLT